ncbi:hypothetical protein C4D60_Mb02t08500 [Musa balbisiana]|uniref:Adenylate isopentenyltransferase n=1 Tax=Musa balbisiana TaxID=52838 RepID=A0A4S8IAK9_MUSBA|nr:hypothetical protein C4D60_Mb02t08500 [Musa balbisiana]
MRILHKRRGSRALLTAYLQKSTAAAKERVVVITCHCCTPTAAEPLRSPPLWIWCAGEERVVVIMGATGTGKSKLFIDLSAMFSGGAVNSDKIQVYRGLDITTSKIPVVEKSGVPHHLIGEIDPATGELPPVAFRALAGCAAIDITACRRVPVLAGGSNSFIHALLLERYDSRCDPFGPDGEPQRRMTGEEVERLRHRCCFLWVHVEAAVLA